MSHASPSTKCKSEVETQLQCALTETFRKQEHSVLSLKVDCVSNGASLFADINYKLSFIFAQWKKYFAPGKHCFQLTEMPKKKKKDTNESNRFMLF